VVPVSLDLTTTSKLVPSGKSPLGVTDSGHSCTCGHPDTLRLWWRSHSHTPSAALHSTHYLPAPLVASVHSSSPPCASRPLLTPLSPLGHLPAPTSNFLGISLLPCPLPRALCTLFAPSPADHRLPSYYPWEPLPPLVCPADLPSSLS
jgi:hypothetical protein